VSFDTVFFRWMVPMEKPTSGIVSSIFWTAVYFVVILWRQCGERFPSNQIKCVCGENRTRLWKDDVIGHVWGIRHVCGTGHVCESYKYMKMSEFCAVKIVAITLLSLLTGVNKNLLYTYQVYDILYVNGKFIYQWFKESSW
jgi:hypothetical protein